MNLNAWAVQFAQENNLDINQDRKDTVIRGLQSSYDTYGKPYCPCQIRTGVPEEDLKKVCPCSRMECDLSRTGHCLCKLFTVKSGSTRSMNLGSVTVQMLR